ncbi:autoinducer binding domain-containing protein [Roseisalinus antarcticus]|nr:autoinducer binding domain-containing protein [Roseisalinus antarcticus]
MIEQDLARLESVSPSGFALAFHIRFTTPAFLFQTYDRAWLDIYSQEGLVMSDPIVGFGFSHDGTGWVRWSDLADSDPAGVLARSAEYGLRFGVAVVIDDGGSRSVAGHARHDREYTDDEIGQIVEIVTRLHRNTQSDQDLSSDALAELKRMSVILTHPDRKSD